MAGRILLNKARKRNRDRKCYLRIGGEAPGQAVSLRLIVIYPNEPLRAATGGRQHVRASSELNLTTINPRPRVDTKLNIKWRAHATKIAESAQIEVERGTSSK